MDAGVEKINGLFHNPENLVLRQSGVAETYPIHTHDFYEFFLVTEGRALHVVNSTTHLLERGSLVFIRPRDVHFYDSFRSSRFVLYNVGLSVEKYGEINRFTYGALDALSIPEIPKHVTVDDALTDLIEKQLMEIRGRAELGDATPLFNVLAASVCYVILTGSEREPRAYMPEWLFRLREVMERPENFVEGLPRLLSLAKYSQEYVNRMFRQHLNTTPTQFINEKRLAHAKELLKTTSLTPAEVCEACGFGNTSHFYRLYRERYGCTPGSDSEKKRR